MICNMKHIQSAKVEKIDKDLIFKNHRKMTKSGSLVTTVKGKKIKNRLKPFIFTNWTILSDLEQKIFFRFLDHSKLSNTEPQNFG